MKKKKTISTIITLIIAAVVWFQQQQQGGQNNQSSSTNDGPAPKLEAIDLGNSSQTVIKNVQIRDLNGNVAYRGNMDLGPTLKRIKAGKSDSHRNDGSTFQNREKRLPQKDRGYYKEYVVRTPKMRGVGPQRIVIGRKGETYYTPDHYKTFQRIDQ